MNQTQLSIFKQTPGAISVHEALAIEWLAGMIPRSGICATLGSHAGKDAIAACSGISREIPFPYFCIDPCYDLENREAWKESVQKQPENMPWGYARDAGFRNAVRDRLTAVNDHVIPKLVGNSAKRWLRSITDLLEGKIAYLFSDADDHTCEQIMGEMELAGPLVIPGGIVAFHDYGLYGGVAQAIDELMKQECWDRIEIPWGRISEQAMSVGGEEDNNTWHAVGNPSPCHLAALRRSSI